MSAVMDAAAVSILAEVAFGLCRRNNRKLRSVELFDLPHHLHTYGGIHSRAGAGIFYSALLRWNRVERLSS